MNVAHKIELKPNKEQKIYFSKACGISRMAYNWGLNRWNELYQANEKLTKENKVRISGMSLKKEFNSIKKEQFPFVFEVTKYACQQPFLDLDQAFKRFFKGTSKYPRFHKKHKMRDSFYVGGDQVQIDGRKVWIPNLGFVKMKESLRFFGKINSITISWAADKWFVSIQVEISTPTISRKHNDGKKRVVGVDLGIKTLITTSDGVMIENPKHLKNSLRKLKRDQRKLSRKYEAAKKDKRELKDSKNFIKQKNKVAKLHYKLSCKRKDMIHKITNYLTKNYDQIVIENLNVSGMVKNHNLAQALSDVSFGEFRRQLEYKSIREGSVVKLADRFYPSSKTCSCCGHIKKVLKLSERTFECEQCGASIDRDLNASINLKNLVKDIVGGVPTEFTPAEIEYNLKGLTPLKASIVDPGIKALSHLLPT